MKKIILLTAAILLCIALCGIVTGCGNQKANETAAATEAEKITLVGQWQYENGGYVYTFNEDGTGNYNAFGTPLNFTYTDKGTSIELKYEDVDGPSTYEYTIEGNTLTIKDDFGQDVKYIRK